MKDLTKFIKSTGIFLIGNVLSKAVVFFMLPLYTKYLSPSDFGLYDLNIAYITFLSSILFLDIWGGIMRFMFEYKEKSDKVKPIFAGMTIFIMSTLVYAVAVFLLGNYMGIDYKFLLFLYGLLMNMQNIVGYIARGYGRNAIFAIGGIVNTITTVICNFIFLAVLGKGYEFLYIASCIGLLLNILLIGRDIRLWSAMRLCYCDLSLIKEMIVFSAPLSINSVAYWFLTSYNKVVINAQLSDYDNGLYAVANKFSAIINIITQCFQMAWQELTFSKVGTTIQERNVFYTKALNEYIQFLFIGIIAILPAISIVYPYMIDSAYSEARVLIPLVLFATFLSCISFFIASIFSTIKKNRLLFTTTLMGSLVNVVIINLTIHQFGVQSASFSLALGYLIVVIRRLQLINKYIDIKIRFRFILLLTTLYCIASIIFIQGKLLWNIIMLLLTLCLFIVIYLDKLKTYLKAGL